MQTKFFFIIALFFSVLGFSQSSFYTVTTNDQKLTAKENSFNVSIIPDQVATAFNLFVQNEESKTIQLQISHKEYGLLVDTSFSARDYKCRNNFGNVEDGQYEIKLISGKERVRRNIEINTVTRRSLLVH